MKYLILSVSVYFNILCSCSSGPSTAVIDSPQDSTKTTVKNELNNIQKQILAEKHNLALIETGFPDSIMMCVAREDSQSISELARMSVLHQAGTIIKDWYNHLDITFTGDDSSDPPAWTEIPDGIAFGGKGFYIVGYGEAASESMSSSQASMNTRMRIGRFFADSLTERLGVIDQEVRDIVSLFGAMIALYGTQESERWTDRSGSRKKCYSLMIMNRDDITRNVVINIANQLKRLYRKDRKELIQLIRKGHFQDYQAVLRALYLKRIEKLEASGKK